MVQSLSLLLKHKPQHTQLKGGEVCFGSQLAEGFRPQPAVLKAGRIGRWAGGELPLSYQATWKQSQGRSLEGRHLLPGPAHSDPPPLTTA